jgi:hypothetical protein
VTVYLIDKGFRRAVPNVPTYEALFRDWDRIIEDIDPETIRLGDPLGDAASLIRLTGHPRGLLHRRHDAASRCEPAGDGQVSLRLGADDAPAVVEG